MQERKGKKMHPRSAVPSKGVERGPNIEEEHSGNSSPIKGGTGGTKVRLRTGDVAADDKHRDSAA